MKLKGGYAVDVNYRRPEVVKVIHDQILWDKKLSGLDAQTKLIHTSIYRFEKKSLKEKRQTQTPENVNERVAV